MICDSLLTLTCGLRCCQTSTPAGTHTKQGSEALGGKRGFNDIVSLIQSTNAPQHQRHVPSSDSIPSARSPRIITRGHPWVSKLINKYVLWDKPVRSPANTPQGSPHTGFISTWLTMNVEEQGVLLFIFFCPSLGPSGFSSSQHRRTLRLVLQIGCASFRSIGAIGAFLDIVGRPRTITVSSGLQRLVGHWALRSFRS